MTASRTSRVSASSRLVSRLIVLQAEGSPSSTVTSGPTCSVVNVVLPLACPSEYLVHSCSAGCHCRELLPWEEIGSVRHLVR